MVFFFKDSLGVTQAFPLQNMNIVLKYGTVESLEAINKILDIGFKPPDDRAYVAFMGPPIPPYVTFMGPPIPPYVIKCYCGHKINVGRDDHGYFIEGAETITFHPKEKSEEEGAEPE